MTRPLRLEYEGALYHITSRGNTRESIFLDDRDRGRFLVILSDAIKRYVIYWERRRPAGPYRWNIYRATSNQTESG